MIKWGWDYSLVCQLWELWSLVIPPRLFLGTKCLDPFCTAEEKEPYEAKARQDKKRYKDEISGYKNPQSQLQPQPMNADSGNESDSE